jgi:hypothetical protein
MAIYNDIIAVGVNPVGGVFDIGVAAVNVMKKLANL